MNTSTSLQALTVIAIGSALLASATPADARGGFRSAPVRSAPARVASFTRARAPAFRFNRPTIQRHVAPTRQAMPAATSAHRSNARSLFGGLGSAVLGEVKAVGVDIGSGKITKLPVDVLKTGSKVAGAVVSTGVGIFTQAPPKLPNAPKPAPQQGQGQKINDPGFSPKTTAPAPAKTTVPAAVLAAQIAAQRPVFVPTNTNGPVFVPTKTNAPVFTPTTMNAPSTHPAMQGNALQSAQREAAARQAASAAGMRPGSFPMQQQIGGRGGFVTSAPTLSPGPASTQPAVTPVVMQQSAPAPVQPSCLRQAVTPDGQIVVFNVCTNQAVVGPLAQVQTQVPTQTR